MDPSSVACFLRNWRSNLDRLQTDRVPTRRLSPEQLSTANRADISLRVDFLDAYFREGAEFEETCYYHFIADSERGVDVNGTAMCRSFVELYRSVRDKGIKEPILAGRFLRPTLPARYKWDGQFRETRVENTTGYQLVDGAHRIAVCHHLGIDAVPTTVYRPFDFNVPDYTTFIDRKRPEYRRRIADR